MEIRKSAAEDLPRIMEIYEHARAFMAAHDNPGQWGLNKWPPKALIENDIAAGKSYVCTENGEIAGTFFYDFGEMPEPGYAKLDGGDWSGHGPYGVVHRIASAGTVPGTGSFCLNWAYGQCGNLRIDTHDDNYVMQNLLTKLGFTFRGYATLEGGIVRRAYEKT